jgi:AraC-like DNA-binding protein
METYLLSSKTVIAIGRIITIIAVSQLLLLSVSVFTKKDDRNSKFILGILLLSFCLFLSGNFVLIFRINMALLNLAHICNLIVFLSAPLLYLFVNQRIDNKKYISWKDVYHFIPFIMIMFFMIIKLYLRQEIFARTNSGLVLISILFTQNIIYLIAINQRLKSEEIYLFKKNNSNSLEVAWIRRLFFLFSSVLVVQLFVFIACKIFFIMLLCIVAVGSSFILTFILINSIILLGLTKPYVFDLKVKYQSSPINSNYKKAYISYVKQAFEEEEIYLDPLLTLEKLSRQIRIPKNHLSQIINDYYNMNFNELINKYRIQKVTEKLQNNHRNDAIIHIAYEVGFNTKSTFNTAFKKFTGMTPSEYLFKEPVHVNTN